MKHLYDNDKKKCIKCNRKFDDPLDKNLNWDLKGLVENIKKMNVEYQSRLKRETKIWKQYGKKNYAIIID